MICIIRIRGKVGVDRDVEETMFRLRLRKKYSCVVIEKPSKEQIGMIKKIENFVAYGEIDESTYKLLIEKRGKKVNANMKPFFSLHPPRKGINSKIHYPKGVLGNHKNKINELLERML